MALDHASVLPRTVVSIVQSSVLGTSRWGNYAQCVQNAVRRRPVETPPNPECCRRTIGSAGIAQACPGTMLKWLLLQKKKDRKCAVEWGPAPGCDRPFSSVRSVRFSKQWSLGCRVPDWDDMLTLLDSALSPVIWSSQFPATSTSAQKVCRHKYSPFAGTCWPNLYWLFALELLYGRIYETVLEHQQRAVHWVSNLGRLFVVLWPTSFRSHAIKRQILALSFRAPCITTCSNYNPLVLSLGIYLKVYFLY